jgi:eukaryotic translation initiation factor 4E transporter
LNLILSLGMPQRIPSPRELQYHTQSIMQNALIRKKLEEQRENYRKRQEQEKQELNAKKSQQDVTSSSSGENLGLVDHHIATTTTTAPSFIAQMHDDKQESPGGGKKPTPQHIGQNMQRQHAPSPSIFTLTPTSVLRKMTAEKENDSKSDKKKSLGMPPQQQQQQQAIRNTQQQPPFMGNFGSNGNNNLSQMDRIKMAQAEVGMFGGNSWDSQSMPLGN